MTSVIFFAELMPSFSAVHHLRYILLEVGHAQPRYFQAYLCLTNLHHVIVRFTAD